MELNQAVNAQVTANANALINSKGVSASKADSNTAATPFVALKPGDYIHGEVVDLRYNEISLKLENSDHVLTAKLESTSEFTIGQAAKFQVIATNSEQLTLKYIPENTRPQQDTTVEKALNAAGLPKNDRNKAIVEELLNHRMPIDKQTLQTLVKQSLINRNASLQTLVLMQKHHIPMTKENVMQFEAYQKNEHSVLSEIHKLTKNIVDFLKQQGSDTLTNNIPNSPVGSTVKHQNLLDILLSKGNQPLESQVTATTMMGNSIDKNPTLIANSDAITNLYKQLNNEMVTLPDSNEAVPSNKVVLSNGAINTNMAASSKEIVSLMEAISSNEVLSSKEAVSLREAVSSNEVLYSKETVSLRDAVSSNEVLSNEVVSLREAVSSNEVLSSKDAVSPSLLKNTASQLITVSPDQFLSQRQNTGEIGTFLSLQERTSLMELMRPITQMDDRMKQLLDGTATITEALNLMKENLSSLNTSDAPKLLQSPEYFKLIEEAFHNKWTLTPRQLPNEEVVEKLYQNLNNDLEKLKELVKVNQGTIETTQLSGRAENLQENMSFMKTLNEMFTYVQLPLQLKEQDAHGDLYVFTKKNALQNKQDSLSVLLHLDMANLGPTDIHINLQQNLVHAQFYLENSDVRTLINENLPSLVKALEKKGYVFHAEVKKTYEKLDFSKDFIEQDTPDSVMTRFSFDIRT